VSFFCYEVEAGVSISAMKFVRVRVELKSIFLDREAIGGLAVAIKNWAGAVVIISHNEEFVHTLCPEIWNMDAGRLTLQGKVPVIEDSFLDGKKGSGPNTPVRSRIHTPMASAAATPAGSGAEDRDPNAPPTVKKKKLTRNQLKAKEERRRQRKLHWLAFGGPKPNSDSEDD